MADDDPTNLMINFLPPSVDAEKLRVIFEPYGAVVTAKVITDQSGASKEYGFVKYEHPEDAAVALSQMNGASLEGKTLKVHYASSGGKKKNDGNSGQLYVSGFDESVTEEALRTMFEQYGKVSAVRLMPHMPGKKGVGFVDFESGSEAEQAIRGLDGTECPGGSYTVKNSRRKDQGSAGGPMRGRGTNDNQFNPLALGAGGNQVAALLRAQAQLQAQQAQALYGSLGLTGAEGYLGGLEALAGLAGLAGAGGAGLGGLGGLGGIGGGGLGGLAGLGLGGAPEGSAGDEPTSLFIYGLSNDQRDEHLIDAFSPYGHVVDAKVTRDRNTGECKGYGFVEMGDHHAALLAMESLQGQQLAGSNRSMQIKFKTSKGDRK